MGVTVTSVLEMRKLRLRAIKWVDCSRPQSWEVVRTGLKSRLG